ncbi:MAG: hypothetical protein CL390_07960 [Acidiferrobacteraceae bacterium]|nr:hypothetical protein [Acidiferrobacteraceae bacterium]
MQKCQWFAFLVLLMALPEDFTTTFGQMEFQRIRSLLTWIRRSPRGILTSFDIPERVSLSQWVLPRTDLENLVIHL